MSSQSVQTTYQLRMPYVGPEGELVAGKVYFILVLTAQVYKKT